MDKPAVVVEHLWKRYHKRFGTSTLWSLFGRRERTDDEFWALKDVSLTAYEGETVGILGRNGSGKSTLLKCICGVLQPTSGEVVVRGKLAGLLELGAGFQQDLTGRENIYLNGSMLGMSKKEVDRVFDDIVDFSELEEFIDGQVKFYSSGMYVRLGFAVAVNVNPDILVVDEVLAVGDERFQRKCIERVKEFQREGRTILLVTHSPDQVRSICDRAVVLSHGDVVNEGPPGEAVRIFREGLLEEEGTLTIPDESPEARPPKIVPRGAPDADHPVRVTYVAHTYPRFEEVGYLATGDSLTIGVGYHASIATDDVVFSLELRDADDNCFMRTDTDIMGLRFDLPVGPGLVNFLVDDIPLLDGTFSYSVGILSKGGVLFDWREPAGTFSVMSPGKATGFITMPVRAWLLPPEPEAIAQMAPEELDYLRPGA